MDATSAASTARQTGREAKHSTTLGLAIRLGLISYGVVHVLVAWLALQLAWGGSSGEASEHGALRELAEQPFGSVLMWTVGVGFAALVVWQLIEAAIGHTGLDGWARTGHRAASAGKVALFGVLGYASVQLAVGAGGGGSADSRTARLMAAPGGRWLVALVGLAVIGYGIGMLTRAATRSFKLTARGEASDLGTAAVWLGCAGYGGKAVAAAVVGLLFAWAAISFDPDKAGGLDDALRTVLEQPFGPYLLTVLAIGIGCYGAFCFVWARHLRR
ncbi:MAG: DUF1206 domain-containing protein [Propionibacteriales bacterium]|nr:DUF1206 domain-containing protein [Propionibacteriales bacterium]